MLTQLIHLETVSRREVKKIWLTIGNCTQDKTTVQSLSTRLKAYLLYLWDAMVAIHFTIKDSDTKIVTIQPLVVNS